MHLCKKIEQFDVDSIVDDSENNFNNKLKAFSNDVCKSVQKFFSLSESNNEIGCAIRILVNTSGDLKYKTFGRDNLKEARDSSSVPISIDKGIPNFFIKDKTGCVIIYKNQQVTLGCKRLIEKTQNHDEYLYEEQSLLCVPIYSKNSMSLPTRLMGLLFITSSKKNIFSEKHVDDARFFATSIGMVLERIFSVRVPVIEAGDNNA